MDERDRDLGPPAGDVRDDATLWAPIRDVPVPPPGPKFMASLMARLDDADAEARPKTARRWAWPRLRLAVAAAAAAAIVLAVVLANLPEETGVVSPTQTPTIAAAGARMHEAMQAISTLQGELVVTDAPSAETSDASPQFVVFGESVPTPAQATDESEPAQTLAESEPTPIDGSPSATHEIRLRFALSAEGDARIEGGTPGQGDYFLTTFDSRSQTMRELIERPGREPSFSVYTGENALPGGPFDPLARLNRMLGSYVRSVLAQGTAGWKVADVIYEGRPAWQLTGPAPQTKLPAGMEAGPSPEPRDLVIVIDKEMGLPVRLASSGGGVARHEERLQGLVLNAPLDPVLFRQSAPLDAAVTKVDYGYRRGPLGWAARSIDYRPLIPTLLPVGYHLSAVLCQAKAPWSSQAGVVAAPDRGLTLVYRRGFDAFVVATHVLGEGATEWGGPNGIMAGASSQETVDLTAGELAGETAQLAITYVKPPMLLVRSTDREYLIDGDLTRDELIGVANSLQEWTP